MQLSDALASTLRDLDLRYVFGVSGANIEHLHDAIHRLGQDRLSSVLAKSEVGAAFMADCRARVHRTLGVCCATSGGGMMNLAVGVAEAFAESVPLLALVGQPPREFEGRGAFQDSSGVGHSVDARALFSAIAKHVVKVESAQGFWEDLRCALEAALSGRPGPSVMLLPRDVFELEVGERPPWLPGQLSAFRRTLPVDSHQLRSLFDTLYAAKRPVLLLGSGVERSSDGEAVRAFAERACIPVATTMGSLNSFYHQHPLFLGAVGAAGHPSAHQYINQQADLIVAVGTGLDLMTRAPLTLALSRAALAVVNVDPGEACRAASPSMVVQADAGEAFCVLARMWESEPFRHRAPEDYVLTHYRAEPVATCTPAPPEGALLQSEAVAVLSRYLPSHGHLLFDAGNCAVASLHGLSPARGVSTTIALGMGGMGYAVAGAVGAQLGSPRGRTVVLCGDGAFLMQGFELHTAIEYRLPILFVVFNNAAHGMCVTRQNLMFAGRHEATHYHRVDFAELGRSLDPERALWTARVDSRDTLISALESYVNGQQRGPGVLDIVLRYEEMPPFGPFLAASASVVSPEHTRPSRSAA
jgi:acetolactate synthase-1/2/3 large subunit